MPKPGRALKKEVPFKSDQSVLKHSSYNDLIKAPHLRKGEGVRGIHELLDERNDLYDTVSSHLLSIRDLRNKREKLERSTQALGRMLADRAITNLQKNSVLQGKNHWTGTAQAGHAVSENDFVMIGVPRAAFGMLHGVAQSVVEHTGKRPKLGILNYGRNEKTLEQEQRGSDALPKITKNSQIFLCDVMNATGGTQVNGVQKMLDAGARQENITILTQFSTPYALARIRKQFPHVKIITAVTERYYKKGKTPVHGLNENGYILPGIGDAGDRLYNKTASRKKVLTRVYKKLRKWILNPDIILDLAAKQAG